MKGLIKRLLREAMISALNDWKRNISDHGDQLSTLISKDNETGNKLYLFVGFKKIDGLMNYSYSFMLVNKDDKPITGFITNRKVTKQYLPNEIKNKRLILPIIEDMTRKLLDKQLPDIIVRETSEPIENDSLIRYEQITNIMVNEYGYKLIEKTKNPFGGTKWVLSRKEITDNNKQLNENYVIHHSYTSEEIAQKVFGHIDLTKLKG